MSSLGGKANFRRVLEHGERYSDRLLVLRALRRLQETHNGVIRVGVSVGRQFGKAVQRNQFRRRLRECARCVLHGAQRGWDLILLPRGDAYTATYDQLRESVLRLARRAGICGDRE